MSPYNLPRLRAWSEALIKEKNPLGESLGNYADAWQHEHNLLRAWKSHCDGCLALRSSYAECSCNCGYLKAATYIGNEIPLNTMGAEFASALIRKLGEL